MFGISPLGWLHTLGSLPAIPLAFYMFLRYGRIVPGSLAGRLYLLFMLIGALTTFLVARQAVSFLIGAATLSVLIAGYGVHRLPFSRAAARYIETLLLSLSAFLLMVPTVSEILRRVPDGHPLVTDLKAPLLLGAQAGLLVLLILGVALQFIALARRKGRAL
ncbi:MULTISPECIES: hypothetical protein [Ochrobactrum]|uniref:Transmembrane protein n=1 Tax=Ochrobactrum quorumnocens TaxID=271865 RepID=A0A5N1JSB8_9HYPH|nr:MULTISPECIES: hypothetical protein [Brucella/Ochrobactrum group]KAA9367087.1 hypothetical protein F3W84_14870 [[Ochrobactrum] quorumnocens]MDH7793126.1 hypothetical protein [Ochrobactrum sp. AN78]